MLLLVVAGSGAGGCLDGHGDALAVTSVSHDSSCPPREGHVHARPLTAVVVRGDESSPVPDLPPRSAPVDSPVVQGNTRLLPVDRSGTRILVELCVSRT
ncbi:hypothetical protein DMH01_18770 [Amycolatopsis sp. WAC 04182]|nr:hypothetical protein DMH01_18770 [Amycolatopsis sp. WAC 04182]